MARSFIKITKKRENGNRTNRLLTVLLISAVWIAVLAVGVIFAWIFDDGQFLIRTVLILPFSHVGIYVSVRIWKRYCNGLNKVG